MQASGLSNARPFFPPLLAQENRPVGTLSLPLSGTISSDQPAFQVINSGVAIIGQSNEALGIGVAGTLGRSLGGLAAAGVAGATSQDQAMGVSGVSTTGPALNGQSVSGPGVYGTSEKGQGVVGVASNADAINGTSSSPAHAGVSANNSGSGFGLWASSVSGVAIYGQSTDIAGQFDGHVNVTGVLTVNNDVILTGADCAEEFDIAAEGDVEPGTVMVLGEGGSLRVSDHAYDRKVAGVISGAGEYRPGLILDRGNSPRKRLPLALVGKVYCKVDAQYGSIAVGDLLTTSPTLGHAMRTADPLKAYGAVIGKALRPLEAGCRLIPILIALQ
jgi:hypothetical protein